MLGLAAGGGGAAQQLREVGGARTVRACRVRGVEGTAVVQGHAAAPDAAGELIAQRLQGFDLLVQALAQAVGQPRPVGLAGYPLARQAGQRRGDLFEAEAHVASGADQRQAAQRAALKAALPAQRPDRAEQAEGVVVADRGLREAASAGDLADGEQVGGTRPGGTSGSSPHRVPFVSRGKRSGRRW